MIENDSIPAKMRSDVWQFLLLGFASLLMTVGLGIYTKSAAIGLVICSIFIVILWVVFFIFEPQRERKRKREQKKHDLKVGFPGDPDSIEQLSDHALFYCDDLIEYYNGNRYRMRIYYIISQITIAVLTGITPILVLVQQSAKLAVNEPYHTIFTWAPIIIPGIASIVASVSTIFHFQEEWVQSKTTAESLEAVYEEYIVGIPKSFSISSDSEVKLKHRKTALENLIIRFNGIHLKQMDRWAALQQSVNEPPIDPPEDLPKRPDGSSNDSDSDSDPKAHDSRKNPSSKTRQPADKDDARMKDEKMDRTPTVNTDVRVSSGGTQSTSMPEVSDVRINSEAKTPSLDNLKQEEDHPNTFSEAFESDEDIEDT